MEGKQTAALVRKGPKLQPIAPTHQFTSHCSVITPKETDDLEKQFDQSQVKKKNYLMIFYLIIYFLVISL